MVIHVHFPVWPDRPATLWPRVHAPARELLSLHGDPDCDQQHQGSSWGFPRLLLRASCRTLFHVKGLTWGTTPEQPVWSRSKGPEHTWMLESHSDAAALLPPPNQYHDTYVPSLDALGSASITVARTLGDGEKCLRFRSSLVSSSPPERSCLKRLFSCFWANEGQKCDSALKQLQVWKRQLLICTFYLHIWILDKRNALISVVGTNTGTWTKPEPLDLLFVLKDQNFKGLSEKVTLLWQFRRFSHLKPLVTVLRISLACI